MVPEVEILTTIINRLIKIFIFLCALLNYFQIVANTLYHDFENFLAKNGIKHTGQESVD